MNREYSEIVEVSLIGITITDDSMFKDNRKELTEIKNKLYKKGDNL